MEGSRRAGAQFTIVTRSTIVANVMSEPRRRSARSRKHQAPEESQSQPVEPSLTRTSGANGDLEDIDIDNIMTNPKSKLTRMDLSVSVMTLPPSFLLSRTYARSAETGNLQEEMFTFDTWLSLSPESREELVKLLPPTAFSTFIPRIDPGHPSVAGSDPMDIDSLSEQVPEVLDPMFFSDSHFLAALRTFQDHLHSGWLTEDHRTKIDRYQAGIEDGTLHAAWKDEAWNQSQMEEDAAAASQPGSTSQRFVSSTPLVTNHLGSQWRTQFLI